MTTEVYRHGKTKTKYTVKEPHNVAVGDRILVQGKWIEVTRIIHRNCHPFKLLEFYFAELSNFPLRFPAEGYQMRVEYVGAVESAIDSG